LIVLSGAVRNTIVVNKNTDGIHQFHLPINDMGTFLVAIIIDGKISVKKLHVNN